MNLSLKPKFLTFIWENPLHSKLYIELITELFEKGLNAYIARGLCLFSKNCHYIHEYLFFPSNKIFSGQKIQKIYSGHSLKLLSYCVMAARLIPILENPPS